MDYIELGKKIYNMENPREVKRCVVFVARCLLNNGRMKKIHQFFHQNELLAKVAEEYPFVYEQPTRAFFYRNSTFDERVELLEQHMRFIQMHFKKEVFLGLYNRQATRCGKVRMRVDASALNFGTILGSVRRGFSPSFFDWMNIIFIR